MAQAPQSGTEPTPAPVFRGDEQGMDDLFDLAEPQPKYQALIEMGGVVTPAEGFTVVASRAAVDEVLRDPGAFTSRDIVQLGNVRPLIPLSVDPPEHKKYRRILDPLFAPKRMDEIEEDVASRVNHFIDAFADRGSCNFTEELAVPFPSAVFLGLMGLAVGRTRDAASPQGRDHAARRRGPEPRKGNADPHRDRDGDLRLLQRHPR